MTSRTKAASCGPETRRPCVAWSTSVRDIPTALLSRAANAGTAHSCSRGDLPLADERGRDRLPDRGGDVGAVGEDLGLARDHHHDVLPVAGGLDIDASFDCLVLRVRA